MADIIKWARDRKKDLERGVSATVAQVNPLDNGRTYRTVMDKGRNYAPQSPQSVVQQVKAAAPRGGTGIGLGAVRSATGLAQGVTGLYDLASPGTGTNRFSKGLDRFAKFTDQTAKNEGVGNTAYKGGQFATDLVAFRGIGIGAQTAAKAPKVAKVVKPIARVARPVTNLVNKGTANLASRGAGGRIAAVGVRNVTNPVNVANMGINTGLDLGAESGKGRDITPQRAALSAGVNLGFGVGLPMAGQAAKEGLRGTARAGGKAADAVQRANKQRALEAATRKAGIYNVPVDRLIPTDMSGYGDLDPQRVMYHRKQIRAGRRPAAITVARTKDGEEYVEDGKHRLQAYKEEGIKQIPAKFTTPDDIKDASQRGYVQMPGGGDIVPEALRTDAKYTPTSTGSLSSTPVPTSNRQGASALPPTVAPPAVAAQSAPPMKPPTQTLTAPAGDMQQPPNGQIAVAPGQSNQKTTRYAGKTVPESEFVSEQVRKDVKAGAPAYDVQTEKARYTDSLSRLKTQGEESFEQDVITRLQAPNGKISSQDVADAQTYAAILDAKSDPASLQKATEIYGKLSEHLTAAGQTVQAAAILARRTPQGMTYWATKTLREAGIEITPQIQTKVRELAAKAAAEAKTQSKGKGAGKTKAVHDLQKFVSDQIPSSVPDQLINIWRAGLLTAPTTTGGNILGNTGETLVRKGFVNPVATAADAAIGLITKKRTQTLAPLGSAARGAKEGAGKLPEYIKTGFDERNALSKYDTNELNYSNWPGGKYVGGYVNGVYRLMSVADQPYWYAARNEALGSIAKSEAINRGLRGADRDKFVREFIQNPPTAALERATNEAKYATFQNETLLGTAASGLKNTVRRKSATGGAVADFFIPFTQVPASIATRIVERTPVGTATELVRQFGLPFMMKGKGLDQRALSQAIANGSFGPAVFAAGYALANSGLLTFGFPEDPKERELWEAEGKQPYSVRLGDRWYSLNYMQPFGTLLAMGGQVKQSVDDGANAAEVISQGVATAAQSVMNQSFLKGISGVLDAIDDPKQYAENWVENTASSVIPNAVRSFTRATDPLQREVAGFQEGIQSAIPGLRDNLPAKQDVAGQDLPAKDNFFNQFINPLKPSKARDGDPVIQEARRLFELDNGVMPSQIKKDSLGEGTELNKDQVRELESTIGERVTKEWGGLIKTAEYKALSDEDKAKALKSLSGDIAAVEKQAYAAKNQLGQYSPEYTGKENKLSKSQVTIQNGNLDVSTYAKGGDTKNSVTIKGDTRGTALLDKVGTMTEDQLEKWGKEENIDEKYKDMYERANAELKPKDWPALPSNNKVLKQYADYLKLKSEGATPLKLEGAKSDFLKNAYKTSIGKESQEILGASANDIQDGLGRGLITKEQLEKAIAYDNQMVELGLSSKVDIPKAVREELGYVTPSGKGGGGKGGGGKKKRNKVPTELLSMAIKTPSIGRAQQSNFSVAAPKARRFTPPKVQKPQIKTDNLNRLLGATKVS